MRIRRFTIPSLLFLIHLIGGVFIIHAQDDATWYMNKPITEVEFEGLRHVEERELETITEPFIGREFTESLFMDLQSKLYALNYFERLEPVAQRLEGGEKVKIVFEVTERPIVDEIIIEGNDSLGRSEILDVILLKRDEILTRNKLNSDESSIQELYLEKGYPDAEVESETEENEEDNTITVTFNVKEGGQSRVRTITFSGNSFVSGSTLKKQIETSEQSLFNSGVFQQNLLEKDKEAIESYYRQNGYVDAKVEEITQTVDETEGNKNFLVLTYYIEEGKQWTYGGIEFNGNELFDDQTLESKIELEEGDVLNQQLLSRDFERVTDLYYNDGYIFNEITRDTVRDEENRTISYEVNIVEKGRAHIENIVVKGNEKTKDKVLYREIPLETGDVFSKNRVIEGMRNLYNTGLFSGITPETPFGSAEGLMDLVYNVEEAQTTTINFGVTFTGQAGDFPVMGFLKWTDNNFRGLGEEFSIGSELSGDTQKLNFSYNTNWLFDRRMSGGVDFAFSHNKHRDILQDIEYPRFSEDDHEAEDSIAAPDPYDSEEEWDKADESIDDAHRMEYDEYEVSLGLNTGYTFHTNLGRIGTSTGLRTGLSYIDYDENLYRPYNPTTRENHQEWRFNNRWWSRLTWDTRDYIFSPSSGFYLSETLTYSGGLLGGVSHYLKLDTRGEYFHTLFDIPVFDDWNLKTVLGLHSSISVIFPQFFYKDGWKSDIQAGTSQMLYTDGMNTDRGWDRRNSGEAMWNNWAELRIPLAEQVLWGDFFFRSTGFWTDRSNFGFYTDKDALVGDDPDSGYRFSYGGGLRFTIPNLPLGLYLTRRFEIDE
ncbi:MAG: outer membrane protein assembly factor BamA, partial [Spirochaetaceae bacterium]